jgi:acyl-CoA thioesterase I
MRVRERLQQKNENLYEHATINIAAFGDSITQGAFDGQFLREGRFENLQVSFDYEAVYHTRLKRKLNSVFNAVPINIINAGLSGDSATGGLRRIERDVIRYCPDLTIVCFGLNDSGQGIEGLNEYGDSLRGIFKKLKSANIETLFMTPNMTCTYVPLQIKDPFFRKIAEISAKNQTNGVMDSYINKALQICTEESVQVCNVYAKWKTLHQAGVDVTQLLSNYINHPTRELHDMFADSLFDMIMFG